MQLMEDPNSDYLILTNFTSISNRLRILEDELLTLKNSSKDGNYLNLLKELNLLDKSSIATSFRVNQNLLFEFRKVCAANKFTLLKGLNLSFLLFIHLMKDTNNNDS
jgi:hypothetical protein